MNCLVDACGCKLIKIMGQAVDEADKSFENFRQWKFQLSEMGLNMVRYNSQEVVKKV